MIERPQPTEVASYYFTYINQVTGDDPISVIENQLTESLALFSKISEEKSLHRYAPEKWSIRQVLNHVTDTERAFAFAPSGLRAVSILLCPATIRTWRQPAPKPTTSPGPPMSRSSAACASPPSPFSEICRPRHGCEVASPAAIPSPCEPWPTSSRDTLP